MRLDYLGFAGLCVHKSVQFPHTRTPRGFAGLSMHKVLAEHMTVYIHVSIKNQSTAQTRRIEGKI